MTRMAPAPWSLEGVGYILIGRFSADFVEQYTKVVTPLAGNFSGGLGALMIVDYHSSDVGAYQELLFIPGRFQFNGKGYFHIPQIYVSSEDSVENGRRNWGIPKLQGDFVFKSEGKHEVVEITQGQDSVGRCVFKPILGQIPFTTALLPKSWRRLIQQNFDGEGWLETVLSGAGWLQPMKVESLAFNSEYFAPIKSEQIWIAVKVPKFNLEFPVAQNRQLSEESPSGSHPLA